MARGNVGTFAIGLALLVGGVFLGVLVAKSAPPALPSVPAFSSSVTVVKPTPSVLEKVRDLKRLESVSFHMERVIDLSDKQSSLFGLVQSEDAILLIAAADVRAGVDLGKLGPDDVQADLEAHTV